MPAVKPPGKASTVPQPKCSSSKPASKTASKQSTTSSVASIPSPENTLPIKADNFRCLRDRCLRGLSSQNFTLKRENDFLKQRLGVLTQDTHLQVTGPGGRPVYSFGFATSCGGKKRITDLTPSWFPDGVDSATTDSGATDAPKTNLSCEMHCAFRTVAPAKEGEETENLCSWCANCNPNAPLKLPTVEGWLLPEMELWVDGLFMGRFNDGLDKDPWAPTRPAGMGGVGGGVLFLFEWSSNLERCLEKSPAIREICCRKLGVWFCCCVIIEYRCVGLL